MKEKHSIVFLAPLYLPGTLTGSEIVVRDLAEELVLLGHNVTVITSNVTSGRSWYDPFFSNNRLKKRDIVQGVHVTRLPCKPWFSAFLFIVNKVIAHFVSIDRIELLSWGPIWSHLEEAIVKEIPDLVVMSPFPAGICLTGSEICKKNTIPYAVIPFIKKNHEYNKNHLLRKVLDSAQYIYTPTVTEKKLIRAYTSNHAVYQLPSSIDNQFIKHTMSFIRKKAESYRKRYHLQGKKVVLFVGNKGIGKGVIDAANAVAQLARDDVVFIAVGNNTSEWNEYLKNIDRPERIIDIPYVTGIDKFGFYYLCDILILPSVSDNFPIVFLEAWAFKKPVLAYDYYTMNEILSDGSGFMVEASCGNALVDFLRTNIDKTERMRKAGMIGYNKIQQYTRSRVVQKYFLSAFR